MARTSWPTPRTRAGAISRTVLLVGLALLGSALVVEAVEAFAYDGYERINDVAVLHSAGVLLSPVGLVLLLAGAILSIGVGVARRGGKEASGYVTGAVIVAVVAVVAFVAGGMVLGY